MDNIDYGRWKKTFTAAQLIVATIILITEVVDNALLYITRSEGYGPDTIAYKLFRYLILTTMINYGSILVGQILMKKINRPELDKYIIIITTEVICTDVAFSHYQFTVTFGIFAIPLILCIFYEDRTLCIQTLIVGYVGLTMAVIARGIDPVYKTDIIPEAAIGYVLSLGVCALCFPGIDLLVERREKVNQALVKTEKMKYLQQVEELSIHMLSTLVQIIDAKDRYTNGHSLRVSEYAAIIGAEMGLPKEEVVTLRQEALLHDIGKIGIPDSVLNKPGRLSDIEFKVMQSHTSVGADILKDMIMVPGAAEVALAHHERCDGRGYPRGIDSSRASLHARIVGIADAYDAMSSDRIYRKALKPEAIREQFIQGRGTQFDSEILEVFLRIFDNGGLDVRIHNPDLATEIMTVENINLDVQRFVRDLRESSSQQGAMGVDQHEFAILYEYVQNMGKRYGHSFEIVMLMTNPKEGADISDSDLEMAAQAMEVSIRKNIRNVDIYTRYSRTQHVAILLNAGRENVDTIIQRVFLDFYKLHDNKDFDLSYETS